MLLLVRMVSLLLQLADHTDWVNSLAFSPTGDIPATASADNTVKLWQRDGTLLTTLEHTASVQAVTFSPDGQLVATAGEDNTAKVWRRSGELVSFLIGHIGQVVAY